MFWGLKLESGKKYPSHVVEKSFHVSQAVLECGPSPPSFPVAVHVIVKKDDYIICYLDYQEKIVQQSLDLHISEGEEIAVYVQNISKSDSQSVTVHLTGSYVEETVDNSWDNTDMMSEYIPDDMFGCESDYDSTSDYIGEDPVIREIIDDEELSDDTKDREVDDILSNLPTIKRSKSSTNSKTKEVSINSSNSERQARKQKLFKKEKNPSLVEDTVKIKKAEHKNYTRTLSGGTVIEELAYGYGKIAKYGRKVHIRYKGRLAENSKVIDCIKKNEKPLVFELGKGEVIVGLDRGLRGMRVGGKRKLTIPATEGYGSKGVPPNIPPNSGLVFEVSLVKVQ